MPLPIRGAGPATAAPMPRRWAALMLSDSAGGGASSRRLRGPREGSGSGSDGLAHPVAAVLGVIAAEKGAADAAGDAVEAAGSAVVDEVFTSYGHGGDDRVIMDPYQGR